MKKMTYYLVSFPKCGNTWIRFILANIYNLIENQFSEIDFHNVHIIVPEVGGRQEPHFEKFPYIFKTHNNYKEEYDNCILLLRNPYDCIYSYYHYLNLEKKIKITLDELVFSQEFGIDAYVNHAESYLGSNSNMIVVTYEEMMVNPMKTIFNITRFINTVVSPNNIENAIKLSSFNNMRQIELKKGRKFGNSNNYLFTRKGIVGEGSKIINNHKHLKNKMDKAIGNSVFLNSMYL